METHKLRNYNVSPSDSFFFDTNVWLHIYGPMAGSRKGKQKVYSQLLKDVISRDAMIFISSIVLSEYINVILRIGFKEWKETSNMPSADYKRDYRPTEHYAETLEDARTQIEEILSIKQVQKRPDDFHTISINTLLKRMNSVCDYNDAYFVWCCEKNSLIFVSDDSDIARLDSKVSLLTE